MKKRLFLSLLLLVLMICAYATGVKGNILTGEKWYDWNGSEWVIKQYDDYHLDSLQNVYQMYRYLYNQYGDISQIHGFGRSDYEDYYKLSYSRTWEGYKEGGTYRWIYQYDLSGVKTSYTYEYDYWSAGGNSNTDHVFTYSYTEGNLTNVYEYYRYFEGKSVGDINAQKNTEYTNSTDYEYDTENRIISEIKRSLNGSVWTDTERTTWTYEAVTGIGIKEIYDVDAWVNSVRMTRTFNLEGLYTSELREVWIENAWVQSQTDDLNYDADGDATEILTKQYDSVNMIYLNKKKHEIIYDTPVGIEDNSTEIQNYTLHQNYPNPFNPVTSISYALPNAGQVELNVYNLQGQLVQSLVNGNISKGMHKAEFNGADLTSGMYIYNLKADGKAVQSKKMMLLK